MSTFSTELRLCQNRKALESFSPRVLRIMFALAPWERSMTYSDTAVAEAQRKEEVLRSFFARIDAILKKFPHAAAAGSPVPGGGPSQCLAMRWEVSIRCAAAEQDLQRPAAEHLLPVLAKLAASFLWAAC